MEPTNVATQPIDNGSSNNYVTVDQFITQGKVALTNAQLDDIAPLLEKRGYPKDMLVAKALEVANLASLNEKQKAEYGEAEEATDDYTKAVKLLHPEYIDHLQLARVAFKYNVAAQVGLGLRGSRKKDEAGYCAQALGFYNGVLGSVDYLLEMEKKGVEETELQELKAGYTNLEKLAAAKAKEGGEAQQATKQRNILYDELKEWFSDFKEVSIIALRKTPQLREKLGWKE